MPEIVRPHPPESFVNFEGGLGKFIAAPEMTQWMRETFIDGDGPLVNPEHSHLVQAKIGVLWTTMPNVRRNRQVLGSACLPRCTGGDTWFKGRHDQQLVSWFPEGIDFLITLAALEMDAADDVSFCAIVEHELLHCAQAVDEFGSPKFRTTGEPVFAMREHDVSEFLSIVARYGVDWDEDLSAFANAAQKEPLMKLTEIRGVCGTCLRKVA